MAIYRKYKPKGKPRKRLYKRKNTNVRISRAVPSGMSSTRTTSLRYVFRNSLTSAGALVGTVVRANSVHDPEFAVGGHRPMGMTTWTSLYDHYIVLGSKITVRWVSPDANTTPATCGIYTTDEGSFPYSSASAFIEARRGSTRELPSGNTKQITTTGKFSAKSFFNIKDVKDNVLRLGAPTTQDPVEEAYYMVWLQAHTGTLTWYLTMTIDYIVMFSEPKDLAQS